MNVRSLHSEYQSQKIISKVAYDHHMETTVALNPDKIGLDEVVMVVIFDLPIDLNPT